VAVNPELQGRVFPPTSPAFAELVDSAVIARDERKGDGPSDHVPVVVDLLRDGDEDDRPMIW